MEKRFLLGLFGAILGWMIAGSGSAQSAYLRIDSLNGNAFVTDFNDSILITGRLKAYTDSMGQLETTFQGDVHLYMLSDSMITAGDPPYAFDSLISIQVQVGLGYSINSYLDIRPDQLRSGPNVIIVWPGYSNPSSSPLDSAMINVEVTGWLGLPSPEKSTVTLYPNPALQRFYVLGLKSGAQVSLFDLNGKLVIQQNMVGENGMISLEDLQAGIYIVKLALEDGRIQTVRLIKK